MIGDQILIMTPMTKRHNLRVETNIGKIVKEEEEIREAKKILADSKNTGPLFQYKKDCKD